MATRLLPYDHPILLTPTEPFNWNNIGTWSSEHTRKSLEECVKVFEGVGLSANQIGIPWRVFSTNIGGVQETHFNPVIVAMSFEMITQ